MITKSLLWKVRKEEGPVSYIFGTMHVKDDMAYAHVDKAVKVLYQCTGFMTEIDLARAHEVLKPQDYFLPDGGRISDHLSAKKFQKARMILDKAFGFDLQEADRLFPILIVNKLTEKLLNEENSLPLDAYLWEQANRLNMECSGLETLEEQVSILRELNVDIQMKMLNDIVANISKFKKGIRKVVKAYADEDIQLMYKQTAKSLGNFRKVLLYNRNALMAQRISKNDSSNNFYAVGAAHLAGQKGLLNMLKKINYKIDPIN